jgi:chromosome segregation ATPase
VSDLECEKDSLTSKLAQLQQVLSLGQAQVAALTVRVTAAEEERDALAGQLQRLRSSEVAAAASAEAGLRDAHGMLTARVAELQEALETARGVLASATANSQDSSGSPIAQLKGALAKAQGAHALSQAETNLALQQARLMRRALEDACMHRDRLEVKVGGKTSCQMFCLSELSVVVVCPRQPTAAQATALATPFG